LTGAQNGADHPAETCSSDWMSALRPRTAGNEQFLS
jgi:hypothetical protein